PATVSITINSVNDVPVANAQDLTTNEDTPLTIKLTGADIEGSDLAFTVVSSPTLGILSGTAPDLIYTPNANVSGTDSFTFKVNDGTVDSVAGTISITTSAVNDVPVANAQSVTTDEDTPKVITLAGSDIEGSSLVFSIVSNPTKGTLSGTPPNIGYVPNANANGQDSFTFEANDGSLDSSPAIVTITINPVNDVPDAGADTYTVNEDNPLVVAAPGVLANDSDVDLGSALTAVLVTQPSHGSVDLQPDGSFAYVPSLDFNGTDSFTYKANDGGLDSIAVIVTITVTAVNDQPVLAQIPNQTIDEGSTLTFTAGGADLDGTANVLTFSLGAGAPAGAAINANTGVFTWTPTEAQGPGTFPLTVDLTDNGSPALKASQTLTVTVNEVNVAPALP
ncbi:MAG: Ig-like domain-containing protein, partial [Planctomycetota bacterium]